MIVAEQVVAALEGGLVTNAVNIPVVDAEDLEVLGPFIPLAAQARPARGRARRRRTRAGSRSPYHGALADYDTRLLTVAALNGAFQGRVDQTVNYVNAPVIAAERGIEVTEERSGASRDYMNLVAVAVDGVEVVRARRSGPSTASSSRARSASRSTSSSRRAWSSSATTTSPGVIGRVGTMFGEAGVNIANMAVSRTKEGGKALMALSIDTEPPAELVERIRDGGLRRRPLHLARLEERGWVVAASSR